VAVRWLSLFLYWAVEQLLIGGISYLAAEVSVFLGDGYAATQRPRLRTGLGLSVLGIALVLWIAPVFTVVNTAFTMVKDFVVRNSY